MNAMTTTPVGRVDQANPSVLKEPARAQPAQEQPAQEQPAQEQLAQEQLAQEQIIALAKQATPVFGSDIEMLKLRQIS